MSIRIRLSLILLFVATSVVSSSAGDREEKQELIREYLEVTNAERTLEERIRLTFLETDRLVADSMIEQGIDLGSLDTEERARFQKEIDAQKEMLRKVGDRLLLKVDMHQVMLDVYAPLVDRYYSAEDLRELIAFYKSPIGQKQSEIEAAFSVDEEFAFNRILMPLLSEVSEEVRREADEEENQRNPWRRTMSDMRSMATAVEAWAIDYEEYPSALTLDDLASAISPTYIRETPRKDGWGTEFLFIVASDRQHYRIVSAGADRRFEGSSYSIASPDDPGIGPQESLDSDIVYQDGTFLAYPKESGIRSQY